MKCVFGSFLLFLGSFEHCTYITLYKDIHICETVEVSSWGMSSYWFQGLEEKTQSQCPGFGLPVTHALKHTTDTMVASNMWVGPHASECQSMWDSTSPLEFRKVTQVNMMIEPVSAAVSWRKQSKTTHYNVFRLFKLNIH